MKLIVGLGNPGEKYNLNRHNVGVLFLHSFTEISNFETNKHVSATVMKLGRSDILLAKPAVFMNSSGEAVKALVNYFKVSLADLYIVHDDLDLKLGECKVQLGVGPKVHYGINSIEEHLGTKEFWRVRIGVDNRDPNNRTPGEAYVLENFLNEELEALNKVFHDVKNTLLPNS